MNEHVMEFIISELTKDPRVSNATLFEGAKLIDKTIGELNPRQFHAKYPLQIKRRLAEAGAGSAVPVPARARAARRPRAPRGGAPRGDAGAAVLAYVTRVLKRNPGVKNAELFKGACEIDASVAQLSPRQFHAKYPLQVKRRLAPAAEAPRPVAPAVAEPAPAVAPPPAPAVAPPPAPAAAPPPAPAAASPTPAPAAKVPAIGAGDAAAIRGLLLSLARDLANAETQAETIEVITRLDGYVDDIMRAARS